MIGQDLLDNYVMKNLEREIHNRIFLVTVRMVLNPTRSLANALAFKTLVPQTRPARLRVERLFFHLAIRGLLS